MQTSRGTMCSYSACRSRVWCCIISVTLGVGATIGCKDAPLARRVYDASNPRATVEFKADGPLEPGRTVRFEATAKAVDAFEDGFVIGISLPHDVVVVSQNDTPDGPLRAGEERTRRRTVVLPHDNVRREFKATAHGSSPGWGGFYWEESIVANPRGRIRATSRCCHDCTCREGLELDLEAQNVFVSKGQAKLTLSGNDVPPGFFKMRFELPENVEFVSGDLSFGPVELTRSTSHAISVVVRLPERGRVEIGATGTHAQTVDGPTGTQHLTIVDILPPPLSP